MTETSSTTDQPELLPVIQADREAALKLHLFTRSLRPGDYRYDSTCTAYRSGLRDSWEMTQAFARHRLTSTTPTLGDMEGLLTQAVGRVFSGMPERMAQEPVRCGDHHIGTLWSVSGEIARTVLLALSAAPASPIPTAAGGMGKARLALEAIKAVTATTNDAVSGLSRIMAITRSAGVDAPYSDLMAKADVALIVNRPRTEWQHLFERADTCTIPPEGWTCSRTPGHDGPCAASPNPTSVNGAGVREALVQYVTHYGPQCRDCADEDGVCPATGIGCGQRAKAAAFVVDALIYGAKYGYVPAALSPALDNTAVEGLREALDEIVSTSLNYCPDRDDEYSLGKEDGLDRAATIARAALTKQVSA